ncbi:hypothetical protein [Salibacterium aidingense]|uniref:hypothetical protein n=1 Tax=Salibacterium aidingense TaxID=384933 RepID=UPI003BD1D5AB
MTTSLTFFGGLRSVGGVQILYGHNNTGLLFDAGISHHDLFQAPFIHLKEPLSRPMPHRELRQYLLTRMAPPILGLYDQKELGSLTEQDLLRIWGKTSFPAFDHMHVFVSHIHQDHMALLPFLHAGITVHMHEDALGVYNALTEAGYYDGTNAVIEPFQSNEKIMMDGIELQTLEVDHNTPGASGFILKEEGFTLANTADWRTHGPHGERMEYFITRCQQENVDMLITESTRVNKKSIMSRQKNTPEADFFKQYMQLIENAQALVYLLTLPLDAERMAGIMKKTKASGKTLVLEEKTALFWNEIIANNVCSLAEDPVLQDENLFSVLEPDSLTKQKLPYPARTVSEITQTKQNYVLHLHYTSVPYLAEFEKLGPVSENSTMIHADAPVHQNHLQNWLDEFQISYHNISTKGHAAPHEITKLTERIAPGVVVPVHGRHPHLVDSKSVKKYLPERGETLTQDTLAKILL